MKDSMIKAILSESETLNSDMFAALIKVLNALVNGERVLNLRSYLDDSGEERHWDISEYYDWYTMLTLDTTDEWIFYPSVYAILGKEIKHLEHECTEETPLIGNHWMRSESAELKVTDLALDELAQALQELELKTQATVVPTTKPKSVTYKGLAGLGELLNK